MAGFGMPKNDKKGHGRFKPKLIGSVIGTIVFIAIGMNSAIKVITGNEDIVEGVAYNLQGDYILMVFGFGFAVGFAYWGIANFLERKKIKAERQKKKSDKSNQHKKRSKEK